MRQLVGFGDRSTGKGTFGGEFGVCHCNQLELYGVRVRQRRDAALFPNYFRQTCYNLYHTQGTNRYGNTVIACTIFMVSEALLMTLLYLMNVIYKLKDLQYSEQQSARICSTSNATVTCVEFNVPLDI